MQKKRKKKKTFKNNNIFELIKLKSNEIKTKVENFINNNNILLNKKDKDSKNAKKIFAWLALGFVFGFSIANNF